MPWCRRGGLGLVWVVFFAACGGQTSSSREPFEGQGGAAEGEGGAPAAEGGAPAAGVGGSMGSGGHWCTIDSPCSFRTAMLSHFEPGGYFTCLGTSYSIYEDRVCPEQCLSSCGGVECTLVYTSSCPDNYSCVNYGSLADPHLPGLPCWPIPQGGAGGEAGSSGDAGQAGDISGGASGSGGATGGSGGAGTCVDLILNLDETDVDCGGTVCLPCATGQLCRVDADCDASFGSCLDLVCTAWE